MRNVSRNILIAVVAALLALCVWREQSPAQGDAPKTDDASGKGQAGRYQLSSWGSATLAEGRMQAASGAYIVDTQTGEVYSVENNGAPHLLGAVSKKK